MWYAKASETVSLPGLIANLTDSGVSSKEEITGFIQIYLGGVIYLSFAGESGTFDQDHQTATFKTIWAKFGDRSVRIRLHPVHV